MTTTTNGATSRQLLFTVCSALTVSFVGAELLGANRFLRTVIQGRSFWYYLLVFLVALGLMLGVFLKRNGATQPESLLKLLLVGIVLGFVGSIIGISLSPLLSLGSLSPTINAWKDPLHLAVAALLALGWLYAILAGLTIYFVDRNRYRLIGVLMLACVAFRLLGMLPIGQLIRR
jgi:hypothetical protein